MVVKSTAGGCLKIQCILESMERKFANHPGWARILQHQFFCSCLDTPEFKGAVSLYCMDAVREPLIVELFHRPTCIVAAGFSWLTQFPANEPYAVTAQYDANAHLVAWYVDICLRTGVNPDGIPWMDDLYLDLVISPALEIEVKDVDELLAAREAGEISGAEFDLAWRTADRLIELIQENQFKLLALSDLHRQRLLDTCNRA